MRQKKWPQLRVVLRSESMHMMKSSWHALQAFAGGLALGSGASGEEQGAGRMRVGPSEPFNVSFWERHSMAGVQ